MRNLSDVEISFWQHYRHYTTAQRKKTEEIVNISPKLSVPALAQPDLLLMDRFWISRTNFDVQAVLDLLGAQSGVE